MIVDIHGHVNAPPEYYLFQTQLEGSGGYHNRRRPSIPDDLLDKYVLPHLEQLTSVGTDVQFISPRPYVLLHGDRPVDVVQWSVQAINEIIQRQVAMHPDRYRGMCALPQSVDMPIHLAVDELEQRVEQGFVGCLLNPDPSEGLGHTPPLGDEFWHPLYAKMVELDVPALVHSTACRNGRESYSSHFITEESIGILSLVDSDVFQRFPGLKVIISHGGGSVPYQIGRWRASRMRYRPQLEPFDESLRRLYFDTALYNKESLEFLFKIVGPDRCMFGTEKPGTGSARDPKTGQWMDDLKPVIESIDWLTEEQRRGIFHDTAASVFNAGL